MTCKRSQIRVLSSPPSSPVYRAEGSVRMRRYVGFLFFSDIVRIKCAARHRLDGAPRILHIPDFHVLSSGSFFLRARPVLCIFPAYKMPTIAAARRTASDSSERLCPLSTEKEPIYVAPMPYRILRKTADQDFFAESPNSERRQAHSSCVSCFLSTAKTPAERNVR